MSRAPVNTPLLASSVTVGEVMRRYPQTVHAFLSLRLSCVGCYLVEHCSLEYAAKSHQVDLSLLLEKLQEAMTGES